jgi:hypothetical protein
MGLNNRVIIALALLSASLYLYSEFTDQNEAEIVIF